MATYQDFTIQKYSSTALLGALPDGRMYYIVGATNADGSDHSLNDASGPFLQIPKNSNFMLPGAGMPSTGFKCSSVQVQAFYYIK